MVASQAASPLLRESRSAARSLALRLRGLRATSAAEGWRAPRVIGFSVALWPQVQTGRPRRADAIARLTLDELLNDAVFQRVVANDHKGRPKAEQTVSPRQRANQAG